MKMKHLIAVSLLLAIIAMGAVSAAEDAYMAASENMAEEAMDSPVNEVNLNYQDEQVLGDPLPEIDMKCDVPKTVKYSKYVSCQVNISNADAEGRLHVYIDEMSEYDYGYSVSGPVNGMYQSVNYAKDFGTHYLYVKYVDANHRYADKTLNYTFTVDDYDLSLSDNYGDAILGLDYSVGINLPFDAKGTLIVTHNGVDYEIPPGAYYWRITIPGENLLLGRNEVKLHFIPAEGCKLPEKTATDSFNATAKIIGFTSSVQVYGEVEDISLTLPKDAFDHLVVTSANHAFFRAARMNNGRAVISLNDLACGKYQLEAEYIGSDYEVENLILDFEVIPKVSVPIFAYRPNSTFPVEVIMSETTQGRLFIKNSFNNEERTYASASGAMTINLTTPTRDTRVTVRYTQGDLTFERDYYVGTRMNSPEFEMNVTVSDALKGYQLSADIEIPSGYGAYAEEPFDGYFVLYIDDEEVAKTQNPWIFYNTQSLSLGKHDWRVEFQNDCYYYAEPKSGSFEVNYFKCEFDENFTLGHSNIVVKLASDASGMITLLVDGNECSSQFIKGSVLIIKPPEDLACGKHDIEVRYTGNYPDISKKGQINADYYFDVTADNYGYKVYAYGEPVTVTVNAPDNATGDVVIEIGDKNYTLTLINGSAKIILTDLECGNYTVAAKYEGDSNYPKKTDSYNFTVGGYAVLGPEQNYMYYGDDESITLALPDAQGNLTVEIDDVLFKTVRLANGKANISLKSVKPGVYRLHAYYAGGDYAVNQYYRDIFHIDVKVIYPDTVNVGEDTWIYLLIPEDAQGRVIMNLDGEINERVHDNGVINRTFNLSRYGQYSFTLSYDGADYNFALPGGAIYVKPTDFSYSNEDNQISFTVANDSKGRVCVWEYNSRTYGYDIPVLEKNVTGPNVSISLSDLKAGSHNLKLDYEDDVYGNFTNKFTIIIPNPVPSITISNSGNDKKAVIAFNLPKDATGSLIVKIDEASHYAEINNGVATLAIDNLASGKHSVSARYSGCDSYSPTTVEQNITVAGFISAKMTADDASVIYSAGTPYSATVYGEGGALAKNVEVIFKINGKQVAVVKTGSDGVARYKVVEKPGTYKITAEALGMSVTKTLTVKHILKLKKVKVKRSAKKLVIKASLAKVNGKYLKGKKIVLKFKGKKYTAKTNKKGVAKFTIKKKVLKKLKKGKKVTYSATYLKDAVKYTVKVGK